LEESLSIEKPAESTPNKARAIAKIIPPANGETVLEIRRSASTKQVVRNDKAAVFLFILDPRPTRNSMTRMIRELSRVAKALNVMAALN
jgi:hypothetical protein